MADLDAIVERVQALDSTLGALPSVEEWAQAAIDGHTKARWTNQTVYVRAMAYWTLHGVASALAEAGGSVGTAGPITSKRTADVSISYAQGARTARIANDDSDFSTTIWGRRYLESRSKQASTFGRVVG